MERLEAAVLEQHRVTERLALALDLQQTAATELEQAVQLLNEARKEP